MSEQLMKNIIALRMERQFLNQKANEMEYEKLFRDVQPGQPIYWHGFGQPPVLSFRGDFDDMDDFELLTKQDKEIPQLCFLMHRNDILIKSNEPDLKKKYSLPGFEALYYIMIQGDVHGVVMGKYKFGPDIIENVMIEKAFWSYKDEIVQKLGAMPGCTESVIQNVTEV